MPDCTKVIEFRPGVAGEMIEQQMEYIGTLISQDGDDNENVKKSNKFTKQNNKCYNLARAAHFFADVCTRLRHEIA